MKYSLVSSGLLAALSQTVTAQIPVKVDSTPQQTLVSFGASGAWWPNDLQFFPAAKQQQLKDFLFSQNGMYLSSYRYNMGGDGGNDTRRVSTQDRLVESFLLRNGTYDWSRDAPGVSFMRAAQQYAVPYIAFFVNAAPSHIASNGAACGFNMTSVQVPPFATYVKTVLSHWINQGINIKYISPMNEPDYDHSECSQEGMKVVPSVRPSVFQQIRSALVGSAAQKVQIIGDETSQVVGQAIPEYPSWFPAAAPSLDYISIHDYDYASDNDVKKFYNETLSLTNGHAPPIKFTEICCSARPGSGGGVFGEQYDPTMESALINARYVWQFLTLAQAVSFDWWTAVSNQLPCSPTVNGAQCATALNNTAGYNDGLIYIDPNYNQTHDYNLYYTKRAYMMKQFAYFHRPGSVRYDVPQSQLPFGVNAIASELNSEMSVLFMNNQTTSFNISLTLPSPLHVLTRVVETTNSVDFGDVNPIPKPSAGAVNFELPAQSMYTLQFCP